MMVQPAQAALTGLVDLFASLVEILTAPEADLYAACKARLAADQRLVALYEEHGPPDLAALGHGESLAKMLALNVKHFMGDPDPRFPDARCNWHALHAAAEVASEHRVPEGVEVLRLWGKLEAKLNGVSS